MEKTCVWCGALGAWICSDCTEQQRVKDAEIEASLAKGRALLDEYYAGLERIKAWMDADDDEADADCEEDGHPLDEWDDYFCPYCGVPLHSCDCGREQSERAEVVEEALREDALDTLHKLESSLLSMLDELRDKIREQVERQNANDEAHCDGRAEMEVLAAWSPADENLGSSSWWLDMPIPFSLSDKGRATLAGGQNA